MHIKFYLGLGLLTVALAGCLWIGKGVSNVESTVNHQVTDAQKQGQNGDLSAGVAALKQAKKLWKAHRNGLASISNHGPMDKIDTLIDETLSYGAAGLKEKFLAGCTQLKLLLKSLAEDHRLTWWNLLSQPPIE